MPPLCVSLQPPLLLGRALHRVAPLAPQPSGQMGRHDVRVLPLDSAFPPRDVWRRVEGRGHAAVCRRYPPWIGGERDRSLTALRLDNRGGSARKVVPGLRRYRVVSG